MKMPKMAVLVSRGATPRAWRAKNGPQRGWEGRKGGIFTVPTSRGESGDANSCKWGGFHCSWPRWGRPEAEQPRPHRGRLQRIRKPLEERESCRAQPEGWTTNEGRVRSPRFSVGFCRPGLHPRRDRSRKRCARPSRRTRDKWKAGLHRSGSPKSRKTGQKRRFGGSKSGKISFWGRWRRLGGRRGRRRRWL